MSGGGIAKAAPWGWFFFLAYIGAAIYFIEHNEGFWGFILGLLQAAVWPAFLIYHLLSTFAA